MRNIIKNYDKTKLQKLLNESSSLCEVISKIGLNLCGAQYTALNKRIKEDKLDISHFTNSRYTKNAIAFRTIPMEDILIKNSTYKNTSNLKNRLIKEGLLKYECQKCKNEGTWCNNKLSLQIDHINGIRNDNRIENLRLLCPNCHSQTSTYAGKSKRVCLKLASGAGIEPAH